MTSAVIVLFAANLALPIEIAGLVFVSITAPLMLAFATAQQRRKERREDWDRQDEKEQEAKDEAHRERERHEAEVKRERDEDIRRQNEVAKRAEETARQLAASQENIAEQAEAARVALLASNEKVAQETAAAAAKTDGQLRVIHGLVNSTLTASKEAELAALERELIVTNENFGLRETAGRKPSAKEKAARDALAQRIVVLREEVAERHRKGLVAAKQIAEDPTDPQPQRPGDTPAAGFPTVVEPEDDPSPDD